MLRLPAQLVLFTLLLGFVSAASSKDFTFDNPSTLSSTQFLSVDEAYKADVLVINGSNNLSLFWQMEPKHFLYRHGFAVEWFSTKAINTHDKEQLNLSDGIAKEDPYFGPVEIYYQSVEIDLPIILSDETLYIKATSQGCADAGLCYPPYSLFFSVNPDGSVSPLDKQTYQDKKLQLHPASPPKIKEKAANASLIKIISILFAAFLGGLILNLMPCVLPILSLKVFQMSNQQDHKQRQSQGMAYLVGVILSFLLVAIIMITLKAAGNQIGWGFQLQKRVVHYCSGIPVFYTGPESFRLHSFRFWNNGCRTIINRKRWPKGQFFYRWFLAVYCCQPVHSTLYGFSTWLCGDTTALDSSANLCGVRFRYGVTFDAD